MEFCIAKANKVLCDVVDVLCDVVHVLCDVVHVVCDVIHVLCDVIHLAFMSLIQTKASNIKH